jgi:hypothetical protein
VILARQLTTTVSALGVLAAWPAFAQTAALGDQPSAAPAQGSRTTAYGPEFFVGFAPRTALDIARRVPGFQLEVANVDIRGFAGAAGNVVINGARPSSKAESIEATLLKIPAMRVVRVEVGPGDLYGAEYSGKNQVLNIILSAAGGVDGNVTLSARRIWTGRLVPSGSASALIKRGASTFNLSAGSEYSFQSEEGTDTLVDATTGELLEARRKFNDYEDFNPYVSGSWALEQAPDRAIRVNARWSPGQFDLVQRNRVTPTGDTQHDDSLVQDYDSPVFELGGDITRPLAGGAIKLVGLATRQQRNNYDAYFGRAGLGEDSPIIGGFKQSQKAKRNETLARVNWSRQDLLGFSFEAGGEAVLNTLDSTVDLFELGPDGEKTRVDLLIDSATVREKRAEVFVNVGRTLSPALRVDAGLTFEMSRLKVRGDAIADRSLKFLKPNATIDWKVGGGWHTQFSIRRAVAQLDFYDFISAAELSNGRVNAGNANLLPQRAWEFRLTVDRPIFKEGLIKLELGQDSISLLQDRVLIFDDKGKGFDAPGNIGTGRRSFGRLTVDTPLGMLWSGLRAKLSGQLQRTRVDDPISGQKRNFSGLYPDWEYSIDVRRDAGRFSYGFAMENRDRFTFFRTDEFDANYNNGAFATAFIEYRPDARTAITLDVDNALNNGASRRRLLFYPNRAEPEDIEDELRERNRHVSFGLTVKRNFGGGGAAGVAPTQ